MNKVVTFQSCLGWFALVGEDRRLKSLTFGHPSARSALEALNPQLLERAEFGPWNPSLVRRLKAYAAGARVEFHDVPVDPGPLTTFQRRVIRCCRSIPYGYTRSYAELAAEAGYPGAARAVGNCMAANRIPLVIPCHRVVAGDGGLGGYSSPGGTAMKGHLLRLEAGGLQGPLGRP